MKLLISGVLLVTTFSSSLAIENNYCMQGLLISMDSVEIPKSTKSIKIEDHLIKLENTVRRYNEGIEKPHFKDVIRAKVDNVHGTIEVFHKDGKIPPNAKANVVLLHGMGASTSNHVSFLEPIQHMGGFQNPTKVRRFLESNGMDFNLAIRAVDLPGHGLGPSTKKFPSSKELNDWLVSYLKKVKSEAPDIPLIVLGRSASPSVVLGVNKVEPGLINGMYKMSPSLSGNPKLTAKQKVAVIEKFNSGLMGLVALMRS